MFNCTVLGAIAATSGVTHGRFHQFLHLLNYHLQHTSTIPPLVQRMWFCQSLDNGRIATERERESNKIDIDNKTYSSNWHANTDRIDVPLPFWSIIPPLWRIQKELQPQFLSIWPPPGTAEKILPIKGFRVWSQITNLPQKSEVDPNPIHPKLTQTLEHWFFK
jgi:hypothetical protein